ncbi:MAG TPA: DUF4843 domain-containing protein [Bacteroidales bacterium]|nr:DUF4843 domain-containing protein [Bacteroidales bacterium]
MIKRILPFFVLFLLVAIFGCKEQPIPTYEDLTSDRYIYFGRSEKDSIEVSFLFYPGQKVIDLPLPVNATGVGYVDEKFKLFVVEDLTTAPKTTYEVQDTYTMRKGTRRDTCYVKLKYDKLLDTKKVRLVVQIRDAEDFLAGRTDYRTIIIWFHNILSKPPWWTSSVTSYYLGAYSDKKYTLFLEVVGVDLTGADDNLLRHYSLLFKKYLSDQKAKGTPVLEEDGTEMVVAVLGNLF